MVERHTIETYGPQPNNRNIWSSRLADSFVCAGGCTHTTIPLLLSLFKALGKHTFARLHFRIAQFDSLFVKSFYIFYFKFLRISNNYCKRIFTFLGSASLERAH